MHRNLYEQKLQAENEEKRKMEEKATSAKANFFETSQGSKRRSLSSPPKVTEEKRSIYLHYLVNPWSRDGEKSKILDRMIVEMIAVDIQPLSVVGNTGFRRLLNFLAPKYDLKSRYFYTETELQRSYQELKKKISVDLSSVEYLSLTIDGWSSKNAAHSLLGITARYIDQNIEPKVLVLAAASIKGRHTAKNMANILEEALLEFNIDHSRIHLVLRDAAAAMILTTEILELPSFDCFCHKLQLADSMERVTQWSVTQWSVSKGSLEKCENQLFCEGLKCYGFFWDTLYIVTKELEERRTTIASVIPIYLAIRNQLQKGIDASGAQNLRRVRECIKEKLESVMDGWQNNRNLIIATMLDPRYKRDFFPKADWDRYRCWLEEEVIKLQERPSPINSPIIERPCTEFSLILDDYLHEANAESIPVQDLLDTSETTKTKAMLAVTEYLGEERLPSASDPSNYWRSKKETTLAPLLPAVRKFHSAPVARMFAILNTALIFIIVAIGLPFWRVVYRAYDYMKDTE
ncbi:zinc finger BED domain-containing protein 4 [Ditylenchus destructor]|uniref:Zinc finger BED domain-containing protein 4 n=1 Tax=Ditylenchus destructor TaxID=166010 RepID=A0AAD4R394_9BILA|nr:zinc finger BED domain-containing protein 4 [Ditylenchus destructor]